MIGKTVSHYRILEILGRGGMGVVYKAEDTQLGRFVALKFLPEKVAHDPLQLERLVREARAAAALNHPNICTIHEIGEHGGQAFIVMEFLEGETLRGLLAQRKLGTGKSKSDILAPLPVGTLLDIAIQIADALDTAHSHGIIHRDIKPANISLTKRGQVKVLDFGLAKLMSQATLPDTPHHSATSPEPGEVPATGPRDLSIAGSTAGTMGYMSPEQARGDKLDARTDLFSFGTVLYEMASGRLPFPRDTTAMITCFVLEQPPLSVLQLNPELPAKLEQIIQRALQMDRGKRYQTASEMRADLESLREGPASLSTARRGLEPPGPWARKRRPWAIALGAVAAVAILAGTLWVLRNKGNLPSAPPRIAPFTSLPGVEDQASFSPDGRYVAYTWQGAKGGPAHISVKALGPAKAALLTNESLPDGDAAWSPDGRTIAFIRQSPRSASVVLVIPASGGQERRLGEINRPSFCARDLAWSPDGSAVVAGNKGDGSQPSGLFQFSLAGGDKRRLTSPPPGAWGDSDPAFSPDGQTLAFTRWLRNGVSDIYLQDRSGGSPRQLTSDGVLTWGNAWSPDGRSILVSSQRSGVQNLWRVSVSSGEIEPLAGIGGDSYTPAVSLRGRLLGYTEARKNYNIWRSPLRPSRGTQPPVEELISGPREQMSGEYSPDGKRIVFASDRTGNSEIWASNADGTEPVQITAFGGPITGTPHWSPDGRWIVFDSRPGGHSGVFVVGAEGGSPRRLTPSTTDGIAPNWSRDGKWIYFCSNRSGDIEIWKTPASGGAVLQVTQGGGFEAQESVDGKWLYYTRFEQPGIWRISLAGGTPFQVLKTAVGRYWTVSGDYLYFLDLAAHPRTTVNRLDLRTEQMTRLAELEKKQPSGLSGLSVSPDGNWIIYPLADEETSRIILVENLRW